MSFRDFMNEMGRVGSINGEVSQVLSAANMADAVRMVTHCWLTMSRSDFNDFLTLLRNHKDARGAGLHDRFLESRTRVEELIDIGDQVRLRREVSHDQRYEKPKFEDVIGILDELSRSDHRNAKKASRLADYVDEINRSEDISAVGVQRSKEINLNEVMKFVRAACAKTDGWRINPDQIAEEIQGCLATNETLEFALPGYISVDGDRHACIAIATSRQVLRLDDDGAIHCISYANIQEIVGEDRDDRMEMRAMILNADGRS